MASNLVSDDAGRVTASFTMPTKARNGNRIVEMADRQDTNAAICGALLGAVCGREALFTSIDYDVAAQATKRFFATVQNKLHWAIHGQTAAEVIVDRADHQKQNMGLSTWKDAPKGKIQKFDVSVAKNYLTENEMAQLQRLVSAYLDVAEDMALRHIPMTMQDWETRLNKFIEATDREILQDAGKVTAEIAKAHAESEFEKYRIVQDRLFESDFDRMIKQLEQGEAEEDV